MPLNFAIAASDDGQTLVLHRADCPDVRKMAADGKPVLTLYDCQRKPKDDIPRHSCLQEH
jgi:hypothetical protein